MDYDPKKTAAPELVKALTAGLKNLDAKDAEFARSLIYSFETRGLSEKQIYWLGRLAARANGASEDFTTKTAVGDLAGVYAMFEKAKAHLKRPAIVLGYERPDPWGRTVASELRITVAGEQSRYTGALQVKDEENGTWWGRVDQDGTFVQSRRDPPPASVPALLTRFAADPVGVAAEHGHLTGKCCFCNRKLTDERSTAAGYGPVCAEHFGLEWGGKAHSQPVTGDLLADGQQAQPTGKAFYGEFPGFGAYSELDPDEDLYDAERRALVGAEVGHYRTGGY